MIDDARHALPYTTSRSRRRQTLQRAAAILAFGLLAALGGSRDVSASDKRPNILFIFSDDHAWQAISAYGESRNLSCIREGCQGQISKVHLSLTEAWLRSSNHVLESSPGHTSGWLAHVAALPT